MAVLLEKNRDCMDLLSRSWRFSTSEISKALKPYSSSRNIVHVDRLPELAVPEGLVLASDSHANKSWNGLQSIIPHHRTLGKWFHFHRTELSKNKSKHKERERAEKAQNHAAVSVAGLATAIAAISAVNYSDNYSKMNEAMASATELLSFHCIELAELTGSHHKHVAAVVQSSVNVRTASDLMTLTATAATALRGAATLKLRLQKNVKSNATVIPYDKDVSPDIWCKEGELLKLSRTGTLRRNQVSIYIDKKSQVIAKLKSKHLGGALSKRKKFVVYGVHGEFPAQPRRHNDIEESCYFSLRTAQGLIEFVCANMIVKQKWVAGVHNLLRQVSSAK